MPNCRSGRMTPVTRVRTFEPRGKRVEVILKKSLCNACGAERTSAADHRENLEALAARKVGCFSARKSWRCGGVMA